MQPSDSQNLVCGSSTVMLALIMAMSKRMSARRNANLQEWQVMKATAATRVVHYKDL